MNTTATAAPIMVGPITMEPHDDADDAGPGSVWGCNPHNGDAVFIVLETHLLADERATPWSATLWIGWEDCTSAPRDVGTPRYATRDDADAAMRRAVAARD
jgi:hypothetical protein